MSQAFLTQLLKPENRVGSDSLQICYICLQDCDTISNETGTIEWPIRLPCSHIIGSGCIARWLSTKNTCPICRREFFFSDPEPLDIEEGLEEEQEEEEEEEEEGEQAQQEQQEQQERQQEQAPQEQQEQQEQQQGAEEGQGAEGEEERKDEGDDNYGDSRKLMRLFRVRGASCVTVVLVSILVLGLLGMVSHILKESHELGDISRVLQVPVSQISDSKRRIHRVFERADSMNQFLDSLRAPSPGNGFLYKGDVEGRDANGDEIDIGIQGESDRDTEFLCDDLCAALGHDDNTVDICLSFAEKIQGEYLRVKGPSPRRAAAFCLFMVSHFMHVPRTVRRISGAVGVREEALRDDCGIEWDWQRGTVDVEGLVKFDFSYMRWALVAEKVLF